jgi:N-acetylglucosamine kinase-like BadF-type ATPase
MWASAKFADEPLILAVDGGQTKTVGLLADTSGRILGTGQAGASDHFREAGGAERLRAAAAQVVQQCFLNAGVTPRPLACACYGISGAQEAMRPILEEIAPAEKLLLVHDTVNAHMGAFGGQPGVIVIAGTGSCAYGVNAEGREARTGGWGYLLGDEGSGYWIALRALSAITKAADGRGRPTRLTEGILRALKVSNLTALHAKMYYDTPPRPETARLATVVAEAAAAGDVVAQEIMLAAAQELAAASAAVLRQLGMLSEPAQVAMVGGIAQAGPVIQEPFRAALQAEAPLARVVPPRFPPVVGSLLLALQALGIALAPSVFEQITATMPHLSGGTS